MENQNVLSKEVSSKFSVLMLFFILIVVLFHSNFRYLYPFIEELTAVSTSYFFCVSAFFFYRDLQRKSISACLKKRCYSLLLPYLLWNLIYILLYWKLSYSITFLSVLKSFTVSPLCTPSWYLLTLFIFLLPAPIFKRLFSKPYSTAILLIAGGMVSYLGYARFQQNLAAIPFVGGYLVRMAEYFAPYLIGGVIGTWFASHIYVNWKKCVFGMISSLGAISLLFCDIPLGIRWILWIILPLTFWNSLPEAVFRHVGFMQMLTEPAFVINMSHCYFLLVFDTILVKFQFNNNRYLFALEVFFTLAATYVLYYLLKLILPNVLRVLTGNRSENKR